MTTTQKDWTQTYDAELLAQRDEPEWMTQMRQQAWEIYLDMPDPPPPQRNLRKVPVLDRHGLRPAQSSEAAVEAALSTLKARAQSWGQCAGAHLEVGAENLSSELDPSLAAKGVLLLPLADAVQQYPELVRGHIGQIYPAIAGKEIALNLAYWHGGYFLYLPRNLQLELPLYVLQSLAGVQNGGEVLFSRSLIVAEAGAQLSLIHDAYSAPSEQAAPSLVSQVLEIYLGANAQLNLLNLQQWNRQVHALDYAQAKLERDARYTVLNIGTGAAYHYAQSGTSLEAQGAEADLLGLFLGEGEQHYRQNSLQTHLAPHTRSDLQYHTVLKDKAYSFYNGMIFVDGKGQQTESNQLSKTLLLSKTARADAIPNLEILADDVQSGHGAAIGSLDPEQMFYLMSRGFDHPTAEAMLIEGFMEAVLLRFPDARLHSAIQQHLSIHLLQSGEDASAEGEQ